MFLGETIINNVDVGKIYRQHKCILLVFLFPPPSLSVYCFLEGA